MTSLEIIKEEYPIHWLVWNNDYQDLQLLLNTDNKYDLEKLDPRGRTPLMLAVRLCHLQSVKILLTHKCNANAECDGWSIVQEAVCSGDPNILTAVLEVRDLQRHIQRVTHVPLLLQRLQDAPDFYVEMKWEFTSWVPLMSRLCPSDVYKVYKRGSNVRIDTTLLGFDHTTWQRGNRSYIFKGQNDTATMIEIDHDAQEVSIEHMRNMMTDISGIPPPRESVNARLSTPVSSNHIDIDKISFERNKTGIWGWRSEKTELINNYECKVYGASNVEFITRTRSEHLNESQARAKNSRTPLQSFLGIAEAEEYNNNPELAAIRDKSPSPTQIDDLLHDGAANGAIGGPLSTTTVSPQLNVNVDNLKPITPEEYFSKDFDLMGRDVGRQKKVTSKVQRFKANIWLSEEFPIRLQEQVLPILDLMSTMASPHVSKLKDFITMQLPSGFPVKIEIPLFHVLNACVTFGNVFALEQPIKNVQYIEEEDTKRLSCIIDDQCFEIPANYIHKGSDYRRQLTFEDEDDLLQYAIQQSLIDAGSENDQVDIWEALKAQRPITPNLQLNQQSTAAAYLNDEEQQLQRALEESLFGYNNMQGTANAATGTINGLEVNVNADRTPGDGLETLQNDLVATPSMQERQRIQKLMASSRNIDSDLAMALRLSEQIELERQLELKREQEMIEQALKLSLEEK